MAASTFAGSSGCGRIVWKAWPPKPAFHSSRCGLSQSPRSSSKVSPRSFDRKIAPGSVPAYTTSSSTPGTSCQTRATAASVSSGKRTAPFGVSCQVSPRSSDRQTCGPSQLELAPASSRGARRTAGVDHAGVDLLHGKVRAGPRPVPARFVRASDPESLAGPDHHQGVAHQDVLPPPVDPSLFLIGRVVSLPDESRPPRRDARPAGDGVRPARAADVRRRADRLRAQAAGGQHAALLLGGAGDEPDLHRARPPDRARVRRAGHPGRSRDAGPRRTGSRRRASARSASGSASPASASRR